jgi:glycosyltransferase involved in cell wall biosynthesis
VELKNFSMPKVSVIIPCYNLGKYIDECVDSILAQTFQDFEIIIVNDGSTDEYTNELLATYSRPKVKVIKTHNLGVSGARNLAIKNATGEYILPVDADDLIAKTYLEKAMTIFKNDSTVDCVYPWTRCFGAREGIYQATELSAPRLFFESMSGTVGIVYKKFVWEKISGYKENMKNFEDWEFQLGIFENNFKVKVISEPLYEYRQRNDSSSKIQATDFLIKELSKMFDYHKDLFRKFGRELYLCVMNRRLTNEFEILNSTSWKITAPLRWLKDKMILIKIRMIGKK